MLDVSTLTVALKAKLVAAFSASTEVVERGTRVNFDPAIAMNGWIGVYPGTIDTSPRAMGGRAWKDDAVLQVVVQAASYSGDGTEASDALEARIKLVLDAIDTDLTLGVTGVRVTRYSREYKYVVFDDDGGGDLFMPQAVIKVFLEVRSN